MRLPQEYNETLYHRGYILGYSIHYNESMNTLKPCRLKIVIKFVNIQNVHKQIICNARTHARTYTHTEFKTEGELTSLPDAVTWEAMRDCRVVPLATVATATEPPDFKLRVNMATDRKAAACKRRK